MAKFTWRDGAPFRADLAQPFGETVATLSKTGPVDAVRVLDAAKPRASPIHGLYYDESDAVMARRYRLRMASDHLGALREIKVTVERGVTVEREIRVYVTTDSHLGGIPENGHETRHMPYSQIADVLHDPAKRSALLARIVKELSVTLTAYGEMKELAGVKRELDAIERKLAKRLAA